MSLRPRHSDSSSSAPETTISYEALTSHKNQLAASASNFFQIAIAMVVHAGVICFGGYLFELRKGMLKSPIDVFVVQCKQNFFFYTRNEGLLAALWVEEISQILKWGRSLAATLPG